jgi:hypothetical protein
MSNLQTNRIFGFGSLAERSLTDVFAQLSKQELVRDEVVLAPPLNKDAQLASAIREMKPVITPEEP